MDSIYLRKMDSGESKIIHEEGQILVGFDDFGVVGDP